RVDPHRRAALDVGEPGPAGAVGGEVDVVGTPVALLPSPVEILVGDVLHQTLRGDAHLIPRSSCWPAGTGEYRRIGACPVLARGRGRDGAIGAGTGRRRGRWG